MNHSTSDQAPRPAWGLGTGLLAWFSSVVFVLLVPLAATLAYLAVADPAALSEGALGDLVRDRKDVILANVLGVLPAHILTLAVCWAAVTHLGREPFLRSLGWEWGGFRWWHALAIMVGFFAVSWGVTSVLPEQEHELMRLLKSSRSVVYAVAFLATFTAPVVEEVVYRGVLYTPAERRFGRYGALLLVTFLFSAVHVPQYLPSYSTIALIFLLSLTLTMVRVATGNLLPCVALHVLFNALQSARLLAEPMADGAIR